MPPSSTKVAETREWLKKALKDLLAGQILIEFAEGLTDEACFHCQQAAEKTLKAFLYWHGKQFQKTHDLNKLGIDCVSIDSSLEPYIRAITPLTQFAVDFRYPGPLIHPSRVATEKWLEKAEVLFESVADCLPKSARPRRPRRKR
jgi:HEPN domain-containing protein